MGCKGVRIWLPATALMLFAIVPPAHGQSLQEALSEAYRSNPTLQAQRAELRSIDEGVAQALSNWRPTITYTGQYGRNRVDSQSGFFSSRQLRRPESHNITIEQPLFRGGRTIADTSRAENQVLAARSSLKSIEQDVLLDAARAYMDVFRDQAVVRLTKSNEKVLHRQLQATRDRFTVGEVTRTDVSQGEARVARAKADRIQAEGDLEVSRASYRRVVGKKVGNLSKPGDVKGLPKNLEAALELSMKKNPLVVSAQFIEKAARDDVELVEGELWPTISVTGELEQVNSFSSAGSSSENLSIIAKLTMPIYQQGAVTSRVRAAKQVVGQRRLEIEEARREAVELANTAWESLQTARARVEAFGIEIRSNEIALEGVRQEAQVGSRTVLDVLDAEQELLDAQVNVVRAQSDEFVAAMELRAAIGSLTAKAVGLAVDYYDEQKHYNKVRSKIYGIGKELSD